MLLGCLCWFYANPDTKSDSEPDPVKRPNNGDTCPDKPAHTCAHLCSDCRTFMLHVIDARLVGRRLERQHVALD